jgi:hypothetical protein
VLIAREQAMARGFYTTSLYAQNVKEPESVARKSKVRKSSFTFSLPRLALRRLYQLRDLSNGWYLSNGARIGR